MISLYALGDALTLSGAAGLADTTAVGTRVGLSAVVLLIAVIGGRVTPSFTRNWLAKQGPGALPAEFGLIDKLGMAAVAAAAVLWVALPGFAGTGWALISAGAATGLRLARWCGLRCGAEPLVLVLHAGYGCLALGLILTGAAVLAPGGFAGLHGLTVGAIGLMTLAIMTRATLGHTGRELTAGPVTVAIYAAVGLAAVVRVIAPALAGGYLPALHLSATLWTLGYGLYVAVYGRMLLTPRR